MVISATAAWPGTRPRPAAIARMLIAAAITASTPAVISVMRIPDAAREADGEE